MIRKDGVPFYLRPRDKFDLHPWTRFNDSKMQASYGISPERSPPIAIATEISHILDKLRVYCSSQFAPEAMEINHILDGYTRFNPHLGREYMFTLKLTVGNPGRVTYRKYHLIRELDPRLSVINENITSSKTVINIVLPLRWVDNTLYDCLLSYSHIGLRYGDNKLHLVVVVFSDNQATLVEKMMRNFTADSFPATISVVTASGIFDRLKALQIGMESLQDENSLAFLADVSLRFGPGFFRRCRSNTELGRRVYIPSAFWLYENNYRGYSDGRVPAILPWVGQWGGHHLWMMCIYKKDFSDVGGYLKRNYSVQLFEALSAGHVDIMQAPDPGLFKNWSDKKCNDLNLTKKNVCLALKRAGTFEQVTRIDYLEELLNSEENVVKQMNQMSYT